MTTSPPRGFTLLEVLAALSVFLVGVISVIGLLSSGTRLHQQAQNQGRATDLVDSLMMMIERELPTLIEKGEQVDGRWVAEIRPVPGSERTFYEYSVLSAYGEGGPYLLELTIAWQEGGKALTTTSQHVVPELRSFQQKVRRQRQRSG